MALTKKQMGLLQDKIHGELERLSQAFSSDEGKFHLSSDDTKDEVDQASADYQRAEMLRYRNRDIFYAKKLHKALDKITKSEYGECEECGCDIKFERLLARPTAELCIECKDESEREEFSSMLGRQSKSLGKQVDLVTSI
jgi:DnaK suppressor protein